MSVIRNEFELTLEITPQGQAPVRLRCSSFTSTFGLNNIPQATCVIAAGRSVFTNQLSELHTKALGTSDHPARVTARITGPYSGDNGAGSWPDDTITLFEGRVAQFGQQRTRDALQPTIRLIHWLNDLNSSSALSVDSHPSNPYSLAYAAFNKPGTAAGGAQPLFLPVQTLKMQPSVQSDAWGDGLKPLLESLASMNVVRLDKLGDCGSSGQAQKNDLALSALTRMQGAKGESKFRVPIALRESGGSKQISASIADFILSELNMSLWSTTFWQKLLAISAPLMWGVIPQIESALVVPLAPGLSTYASKTYNMQIPATEVSFAVAEAYISRPVRALVVYGGVPARTMHNPGNDQGGQQPINALLSSGCYAPNVATTANGLTLIRQAPFWLANVVNSNMRASRSAFGGAGGMKKVNGATTPPANAGDKALVGGVDGKLPGVLAQETHPYWQAYAKALYVEEALRGRMVQVHGKLRFDVAPGSTVRVAALPGGKFLSGDDSGDDLLGQTFIGTVVRVTIGIDAESEKAGTTLQLAYAKTDSEAEDPRYALDEHPLYRQAFVGAPLHDDLYFGT